MTLRLEILKSITTERQKVYSDWAMHTNQLLAGYACGAEWREIVKEHISNLYIKTTNKKAVIDHIVLINLIRYIVRELSLVHEHPGLRKLLDADGNEIKESDKRLDIYNKLMRNIGYDQAVKLAEERANLLNCNIIYMAPDFGRRTFSLELIEAPELVVDLLIGEGVRG